MARLDSQRLDVAISRRCRVGAVLASWLVVFVGIGEARAQETALIKGAQKTENLFTVNLGGVGQPSSTAYRITIPPGIQTADHTHTGRMSIFVMLQGTLTEVRGTVKHEYKPGETVVVEEGITHHAENFGAVPIIYIEISTTTRKQ